jgi:hypothetical protein
MMASTSTQTPASGARLGTGTALPKAGRGAGGAAPLKSDSSRLFQTMLFWVGASLLPLGLVVIVLGWYGVANTPFGYDQQSYMISGGFGGLALTFVGGFLYFGSWLARIAEDNRESSRRLADTLLVLADVTSRAASLNDRGVDVSALPVTAGDGTTVHRRDCALIAHRGDLRPVGDHQHDLVPCRVCRP